MGRRIVPPPMEVCGLHGMIQAGLRACLIWNGNLRGKRTMADVALQPNRTAAARTARKRSSLQKMLKRKSSVAFLMALPLILLIATLVIYPAFYALHLASLNKSMVRFIGLG